VEVEKDLGVLISADLKCSQQCVYACNKANKVMGMIRRTIRYREPRIINPGLPNGLKGLQPRAPKAEGPPKPRQKKFT